MATDGTERSPILTALRVRRNVAIGAFIGIIIATLAFLYRVVLIDPAPGAVTSPWLFAALAFVLAVAVGGLVAIALTVGTVISEIRRTDSG